jgi:hypothetical protein
MKKISIKFIFIKAILIFVLSPIIVFSFENKASVDIYQKCPECVDHESLLEWLELFKSRYGSRNDVIKNIRKHIDNKADKNATPYDDIFYQKYGVYIFLAFLNSEKAEDIKIMQHLLKSGVHPYDSLYNNQSIVGLLVTFENIEGVKLMVNSGRLADSEKSFKKLRVIAKDTNNRTIISMLEKIRIG